MMFTVVVFDEAKWTMTEWLLSFFFNSFFAVGESER